MTTSRYCGGGPPTVAARISASSTRLTLPPRFHARAPRQRRSRGRAPPPAETSTGKGVRPMEETLSAALMEQARGVVAERFAVDITTADAILQEVARTHRCSTEELAAAVVTSCTDNTVLPRRLYAVGPNGEAA